MDRQYDEDWLECCRALKGGGFDEEETAVAWLVSRGRENGRIVKQLGIAGPACALLGLAQDWPLQPCGHSRG